MAIAYYIGVLMEQIRRVTFTQEEADAVIALIRTRIRSDI